MSLARTLMAACAVTAIATTVTAQQNVPGALRDQGPRPGVAAWVATNPATLQLTAAQLCDVQARMSRLEQELVPLRGQVRDLRTGRDLSTMTRSERHSVIMAAAALRGGMLTLMDSADADVRGMLNATQQRAFDAQNATLAHGACPGCARRDSMGGAGMRGRGRGGMMQRGNGMGMRMGMRANPGS